LTRGQSRLRAILPGRGRRFEMAQERLYMNAVNGWDKMDTAVTANNEQVAHLEVSLPKLRQRSQRARSLYAQYAAMVAAKQEVWKELQQVLEEGDAVMRYLKEGVRAHYGKRNEKLVEFGVRPFRGIKRKSARKPTAPDVPPALTPDSAK
jgi:molybdopterin converting factor small subunit